MTTTQQDHDDERKWFALVNREKTPETCFFYGVTTTGIYCRPGCSSRLPRRENVRFFASAAEADRAGFRPCRRCTPEAVSPHDRITRKIIEACRFIESSPQRVSLKELAATAGLSQYHFHRQFKKVTGITPAQYAKSHRAKRFHEQLKTAPSVTDAIYGAGYSSSSRPYSSDNSQLSMSPSTFRAGGTDEIIRYATAPCSLGWVIIAATPKGICAVEFADTPESLTTMVKNRFPKATLARADAKFDALVAAVIDHINNPAAKTDLPLDIRGTAFQQRVWALLREIKPGDTQTYSDVARKLGMPEAVRAVASAIGKNSIAVLIPCHRVISKNGKLSGYRWGVERKERLLETEQLAGSKTTKQ